MFGEVKDAEMCLTQSGEIANQCWDDLVKHYHHISLDTFVVMPNHIHGIIHLKANLDAGEGAGLKPAPTTPGSTKRHGLSEIVRGFKTFSARRINHSRSTPGAPVWQRNYYEHVIRNEKALNQIRQYLLDNPGKWDQDPENPGILKFYTSGRTVVRPDQATTYPADGNSGARLSRKACRPSFTSAPKKPIISIARE